MRYYLKVIVSLALVGGGFIPVSGGFDMVSRGVAGKDVYAAFIIGGLLMLVGVLIYIAAQRARDKPADADTAKISARAVATRMTDDFSDDSGDSGDSGGDGGD